MVPESGHRLLLSPSPSNLPLSSNLSDAQFGACTSSENCILCTHCFLCQNVICMNTITRLNIAVPKVIDGNWNKQFLHVNDSTVKVCGSPGSSCPSGDSETQFLSTLWCCHLRHVVSKERREDVRILGQGWGACYDQAFISFWPYFIAKTHKSL